MTEIWVYKNNLFIEVENGKIKSMSGDTATFLSDVLSPENWRKAGEENGSTDKG